MSAVGPGRLGDDLGEVLAEPVVGHAAVDVDPEVRDVREAVRVVRLDTDRLGEVLADLVLVDVEGRDELDVTDVVSAEVDVHEAGDEVAVLGIGVVVAALDQAAGAVADAHDGDAHLAVAGPMAVAGGLAVVASHDAQLSLLMEAGLLAEAPDVVDALDDGRDRQDGEDDEDADETDGQAEACKRHARDDEDEALGARCEPDVGRQADALRARVRIADEQRAAHGDHERQHRQQRLGLGAEQPCPDADEDDRLARPIERRVEEGAERRAGALGPGQAAVDRVEQRSEGQDHRADEEHVEGDEDGGNDRGPEADDGDRVGGQVQRDRQLDEGRQDGAAALLHPRRDDRSAAAASVAPAGR